MLGFLLLGAIAASSTNSVDIVRPNIVWVVVEDMSAHFGCYGEKAISTPNLDQMATKGTRFSNAFVTGPICSISRSAMITGMYQTSIGAQHHRSGRGSIKINLPKGIVPVPALFQQAGYHTSNCAFPQIGKGKTDYNFEFNPKIYDGNDWSTRKNNQPFFTQVQIHGGKYREGKNWNDLVLKELGKPTDPNSPLLKIPPYYPNDTVIRNDWAAYLDTIRLTDKLLGQLIERLKNEKVLDNTIIFFWTDHGISHARGKQFLYEEGIHVPLVVHGPKIASNKVRDDLVEHIDIAASSLAFAGIPVPQYMQGRNIFAVDYKPREFAFSARDRADETVEHIRSVRSENFKYIRNYLNERPHLQPNGYKDGKQILIRMKELFEQGKLDPIQSQIYATKRPKEELYDLRNDPWEIKNLASDQKYATELERHRKALADWEVATNDMGRVPETEAQYDSDMAEYLGPKKGASKNAILIKNIEQMKQWAKEGK